MSTSSYRGKSLSTGVRALRLIPVGNSNIFGRKGLLAHTYMLGPKGDLNGCVVFKNYTAFSASIRIRKGKTTAGRSARGLALFLCLSATLRLSSH